MIASSGVDVVTAIAVGGRGWAGGGTAVPVISGVDLCADVDLDVTAVRRRVGGGQVGASTPTSQWSDLELVVVLAVASTPMPPRSEVEPVVVLVVASTSDDVTTVGGRASGCAGGAAGVGVTAVGERAGGDAGAPVSSDTDVVVSGSAIVEVEVVVLQWSSATAPLATADGEVSLGSTPSGSSTAGNGGEGMEALVPGCGRVCRCE